MVESQGKETGRHLARNQKGATSVEYAIIASLIAGVVVMVVAQLGIKVSNLFVINGW